MSIQIKRGHSPTSKLKPGEFGFDYDTNILYVGDETGQNNIPIQGGGGGEGALPTIQTYDEVNGSYGVRKILISNILIVTGQYLHYSTKGIIEDKEIKFGELGYQFKTIPTVNISYSNITTVADFGQTTISAPLSLITTTGFTSKMYNYSVYTFNPVCQFLAIGEYNNTDSAQRLADDKNYNKLLNAPILNLYGSSTEPIDVSQLGTGHYYLHGQTNFSNTISTNYTNGNLLTIEAMGTYLKAYSYAITSTNDVSIEIYTYQNKEFVSHDTLNLTQLVNDAAARAESYAQAAELSKNLAGQSAQSAINTKQQIDKKF